MTDINIDKFKEDIRFRDKIEYIETIPGHEASYKKVDGLHESIIDYLSKKNISLYTHQADAYNLVKEGKNIIITTPTASGKTLCFNLPILDDLIRDEKATALYIYPAKALSHDQLRVLKNFEDDLLIDLKPACYDGDTHKRDKYSIRQKSRIVLTNPYQLHHILSWHHQWRRFYSHLKYIVIDESHYYKGIFGSNVALLIRRLRRVAEYYGSDPQFILSSATLANPLEHANKLTGKDFELISEDASASGEKDFILYNPYKNLRHGKRKKDKEPSIHQATEFIFMYLILKNIQTLCFTVSRKTAELIALWTKRDLTEHKRKLVDRVTAYRAGYLASDRREIEEGLKTRKYLGVTTTNALELGINIGTLDAVIISGYPGTMVSTWQQGGRCGRGKNKSLVILIAFENQLDQYFMKNPEFFFGRSHENAIIDLKNEILLKAHLICASNEIPLKKEEIKEFSPDISNEDIDYLLEKLTENRNIAKNKKGQYYYPYDDSPSFKHSLDQLSNNTFKVMCGNKLIEVMELSQVYSEAYEGAVLIHQSETYIVTNINFKTHYVNVVKRDVPYHTTVLKDTNIKILEKLKKVRIGKFTVHFGTLEVRENFDKYKKYHFSDIIGTYKLDLPPLRFKTKGLWFTIDEKIKDDLEEKYPDKKDVFAGGLHGAEHALIGLFPLHTMCDRFDIGGMSTNYHDDTQEATIFIYDAYEGGIGITEKAIDVFYDLVKSTKQLLDTCECEDGCPKCIYSPKCGNDNKPLDKNATKYILDYVFNELSDNPDDVQVIDDIDQLNMDLKRNKIKIESNNRKKAYNKIQESVETEFNEVENKYVEALDFYDQGNYSYAKDILTEIINIDRSYSNAWYLIGDILYQQGDIRGALNFLKKAITINPSHVDANDLYVEVKDSLKNS
jgi:DEAD/DEAH box helicase domain-containing protein